MVALWIPSPLDIFIVPHFVEFVKGFSKVFLKFQQPSSYFAYFALQFPCDWAITTSLPWFPLTITIIRFFKKKSIVFIC